MLLYLFAELKLHPLKIFRENRCIKDEYKFAKLSEEIRSMQAVSKLPYNAETSHGSPLRFKTGHDKTQNADRAVRTLSAIEFQLFHLARHKFIHDLSRNRLR